MCVTKNSLATCAGVDNRADEIMTAIVGDDQLGEFPTGFSIVGHVGT